MLPIYGRDLFENPFSYRPDASAPAPSDYVLGPGDEVKLQVWGGVEYTGNLTIDRNGQINLPRVGAITLAGVPVRDVESVLRRHMGQVFTNFSLNANPGRLRSIQVYVVGQAIQPGAVQVSGTSTLINALFASGGPTSNGSMRNIQLRRGNRLVTTLDLYDFIGRGDKSKDIPLQPGDVIVIPPVGARVAITGTYDQAAIYELKSQNLGATTLGELLSLGGGVPTLVEPRKATLERIFPDKTPPRQVIDLNLSPEGLRQTLRDGDVITLMPVTAGFSNAVTLQGRVAQPIRQRWFEGMRILDLIPDRDALIVPEYYKRRNLLLMPDANVSAQKNPVMTPDDKRAPKVSASAQELENLDQSFKQPNTNAKLDTIVDRVRGLSATINWDYAVIERLNRTTMQTELIPFNLGLAVLQRDPQNNLPLRAGDVVTIFSQEDVRLPIEKQNRLVRVEGEVRAPGVYQVLPGETLAQLIDRIGGVTPQAYVFGTEFTRESVRKKQQENLNSLIKRMEYQLQSQSAVATSSLSADRAAQSQALQQQQQQQLKAQVERLRSFNSNGRMSLELEPSLTATIAAYPSLPLEDGDRVVIPSMPGYISAFGSVNNENVMIYKPGKTVEDVIRSAGLMEDAELDYAFVLRADGSVVSRKGRGMFTSFEGVQVMPGDTVVVPAKLDRESRYSFWTRVFKDWTQILANFGLGVIALKQL
ncbi:MAG: SLBB domain-containing protein [Burkholderiales bacterium]|nr:SLBB domain-containing protein [Burkholderiales bacterium]